MQDKKGEKKLTTEFTKKYEKLEGLNLREPTSFMLESNLYHAELFIKAVIEQHKAQLNSNEWSNLHELENLLGRVIGSLESRLDPELVKLIKDRKLENHEHLINPLGTISDEIHAEDCPCPRCNGFPEVETS